MIALVLLILGLGSLAGYVVVVRRPQTRTVKRRLEAVKNRHAGATSIETQLRKIAAQRGSGLDETFLRFMPRPELLRRRIEMAGPKWTLTRYATTSAVITVIVWLLLGLRGMPLLLTLFLGLLAGIGVPYWLTGKLCQRRIAAFTAKFPDAIELLVRGLRSGLPIGETLTVVGNEVPDPVGSEFRAVSDRIKIGRTMDQALQETADKLGTPEFQFFVITLAIQRETGGNLAETLANLAEVLRKRMQMKLKIKAMSSESKASAWIIGSLPFIVFLLIWFLNPTYMGTFFKDQRLIITAMGGAMWMGMGVFIMSRMISFEI